jgi:hypothetical protein
MGWLVGWAFLSVLSFFFSFSFFPSSAAALKFLIILWRRLASPYGRLGVA